MNENIQRFTEQSMVEKKVVSRMICKLAIRIKGVCFAWAPKNLVKN